MKDSICAIIPALNEEQTIESVVRRLYSYNVREVIVVDNGSTDATSEVATLAGAKVVQEKQKGYGKACLTGITALPKECDWVLFCDADGSDDLESIPLLAENLVNYDFIIGNRRATAEGRKNLTPVQNFGNWLSGFLMKAGWGRGFSDLGPMRLIRKTSLEALEMKDENFGWTVEMQAKSINNKLRTREVPVNYYDRQGGVSKISGNLKASFQAGVIILSTLGRLWLERRVVQLFLSIGSVLLLLAGSLIMGRYGDPASGSGGVPFMVGGGMMLTGFLCAAFRVRWHAGALIALAVVTRLFLLPMPPGDDIWRYIWEGLVQLQGHNPYNTPPSAEALAPLRTSWWGQINHPEVTAIYPPLAQLIFKAMAAVSTSVIAFKAVITLADLAIGLLLLRRFGSRAALYLLNPLVIYCFSGGAHYESLMMLPMVVAFLIWEKQEEKSEWKACALVGLLMGASVGIKVVSILAAGFIGWSLIRQLVKHRQGVFPLVVYSVALLLLPVGSYLVFVFFQGVPESLSPTDFTRSARSTSLIPWISDSLYRGPQLHNAIFLVLLSALLIPVTLKTRLLMDFVPRSTVIMLAIMPMVHAWYFTWAIPFAIIRHRLLVIGLSITGWLYFLYPYRQSTTGDWTLYPLERLLIWSPLAFLLLEYRRLREL